MIESTLKLKDNFEIHYTIFDFSNPKGLVLLVHGAKEHRKRYYDFAKYLNSNGFIVAICDNRGHGQSVDNNYPLGYMSDYKLILSDLIEFKDFLKNKYNVPFYLFGHSLGSMFARMLIAECDNDFEKLVLSGTANYVKAGVIGIFTGNVLKVFKGSHGYSKLLERFANFLDDSWVVGNKDALEKYRSDKYCTYKYPISSMIEIFRINHDMHNVKNYKFQNKDLEILSVSGALDPVTGFEKGLNDSKKTLEKIGYRKSKFLVYDNMYHEVLNETDNKKVYKDILDFLSK